MTDNANKSAFAMDHYPAHSDYTGLTKREYFAGQALVGIIAADVDQNSTMKADVAFAVRYADALLSALEAAA